MKQICFRWFLSGIAVIYFWSGTGELALADQSQSISRMLEMIQDQDSVLVTDPQGKIVASKHADQPLTPASTLKILTVLAAFHYLGEDYRFVTDCYLDSDNNLKIKGWGDPLFVSDIMPDFAAQIHEKIPKYNDLILDDSAFRQPLVIPGVSQTSEPYDAPNGALCANFNTVSFQKTADGRYIAAEPQTPLLPFVMNRIRSSGVDSGRIVFSHLQSESVLYAGHLLGWFLSRQGIASSGQIKTGSVKGSDRLLLSFISPYTLRDVTSRLLEFSSNYIANQLFITIGIKAYGLPGTIEKGIRAVQEYCHSELKTDAIQIAEGSGISRNNRISAVNLDQLLVRFYPYRQLMRKKGNELFKTGTLDGVRTRAGYIEDNYGRNYRFVVMFNTPGKTVDPVMDIIREMVSESHN